MKNIKTYEQFSEERITFKQFLKNSNDVVNSDTSLWLYYNHLIDLDGAEEFVNLTELYCYHNEITSLNPLKNLTKLTYLDCENNYITSLEPIENLINIKIISCFSNEITTLKGIENLINLKEFSCEDNPIDWVDYIDKQGNTWYIELPKSITHLTSDKFETIKEYWEFMEKNQPAIKSRKFNF